MIPPMDHRPLWRAMFAQNVMVSQMTSGMVDDRGYARVR